MRPDFDDRARFLVELGRRLHIAGVSATRLEGAIRSVAQAIGITCQIWSTPTGLLLSLGDSNALHGTQQTRVLRLEPGDTDLSALVALDDLADRVSAGTMSLPDAWQAMMALDRPPTDRQQVVFVASFGLAASSVAALVRTGWLDIALAGVLGLVIGWIALMSRGR